MQKSLVPDKKFVTKSILVSFLSTLATFASLAAFIHFIAYTKGNNAETIRIIWSISAVAFVVTFVVSIPITLLWIKNLMYVILEDRVTVHKGILTKIQKNIPLRAVTDFILERSLFDRMLGIGTIKIQTAGQSPSSAGYEGKLAGLLDYQALHEELRQRIGKLHSLPDSATEKMPQTTDDPLLKQILAELIEIKKNTEPRNKS
jgi:uncharacterized membrane protein YdbT with pleckstrin-like domain